MKIGRDRGTAQPRSDPIADRQLRAGGMAPPSIRQRGDGRDGTGDRRVAKRRRRVPHAAADRPPIESSDITATAMSLRAIQLYGSHQDEQVARAARWLLGEAHTTEDAAMQLLGLAWARQPDVIRTSDVLLALQRPDGGWAQLPTLEQMRMRQDRRWSRCRRRAPVSSPQYQKGVGFLLRTQFPDGSWLFARAASGADAEGQRISSRSTSGLGAGTSGRRWRCCWRCRRSRRWRPSRVLPRAASRGCG